MKINVISVVKNDSLHAFYEALIKQCLSFGCALKLIDVFNGTIAKAQKSSPQEAQKSYTQALLPYLGKNNFALHPAGVSMDSQTFAELLRDRAEVCFFVGGAYGFDQDFLNRTQSLSLSPLTLSHQVAKVVLCEQIYRALSIIAKHPYHK